MLVILGTGSQNSLFLPLAVGFGILLGLLIYAELQKSEECLRSGQEILQFVEESGEFGRWEWYPQTGVVYYSDNWIKMLGYSREDIDSNFSFFVRHLHPEDRERVFDRLLGHVEGRASSYKSEHRIRAKSGEWKWVLDRGKVIQWDSNGHASRVEGLIVDITERKIDDEAWEKRVTALTSPNEDTRGLRFEDLFNLDEIQQIQDAFAEATGVASVITDTSGRPLTRPSNFCRLCKDIIRKSEKGLLNCYRSDAALGQLHPGGPMIQPCLSGGLIDGGASICAGDEHIANWLIGQVRDESVHDETILAYAREIDVNEAKFREALQEVPRMPRARFEKISQALFLIAGQLSKLALQNIQQARTLTERKREGEILKHAKEAAEAANSAKDQFIAVLSHELRTPLTPVLATVTSLETSDSFPDHFRSDIHTIRRNVEMESRLIDDLLDVTRISKGKIELYRETVDAHACLQNTVEICKNEIADKDLKLSFDLSAANHYVLADAARLQQVFWNLLKNGIKFTPEGGSIRLSTSNEGERLRIAFTDTGIGIEPELMDRIFNAFEQGEQTKTRQFGGLGLGLSIAKTVVELHDGTLTCQSDGKNRGACFSVELGTVAPPNLKPASPKPETQIATEKTWRILLVEDHPDTLKILSRLLKKWGYEVIEAASVQDATKKAEKQSCDILVSDLGLPDGSGLDLMRYLKPRFGIRGIALSGYGTEDDIQQSREAGFEVHLIKPVGFELLRKTLQQVVAGIASAPISLGK